MLAHTLKGSARGIGAWRVARAAEALELAGASGNATADALDRLAAASDEARAVIADLLRGELTASARRFSGFAPGDIEPL